MNKAWIILRCCFENYLKPTKRTMQMHKTSRRSLPKEHLLNILLSSCENVDHSIRQSSNENNAHKENSTCNSFLWRKIFLIPADNTTRLAFQLTSARFKFSITSSPASSNWRLNFSLFALSHALSRFEQFWDDNNLITSTHSEWLKRLIK